MTTNKKTVCECGRPCTTRHAGENTCEPCKVAVTAAQESLADHIRKTRSSDSEWERAEHRREYEAEVRLAMTAKQRRALKARRAEWDRARNERAKSDVGYEFNR